jgi:cyclic pyranopterin phosphate synthase
MPPEGIEVKSREQILTFEEIERVARIFAAMGVTKIRLTGGEPLVRKGLPTLVERLAAVRGITTLAMTTNGVLLQMHARELRHAGLTHLNVSLDTLRRERFQRIALRSAFDDVLAGIEAALAAGFTPLKLNVVVMGGVNDDELPAFIEFVRNKPINVRFIEYMPFKSNEWNAGTFFSFQTMKNALHEHYELIPLASSDPSDVAKDFRIPGILGTVSFITSMSDHFCAGCSRVRLMADGSVKSCLFRAPEVNVRAALRGGAADDVLAAQIRSAIALKHFEHPPMEELAESGTESMIEIGG